jgi:hypothetical protein
MARKKPQERLREGEQVPTDFITIEEIMSTPEFALGALDLRAGRGYRAAYATWDGNQQWDYERGRHWAVAAPRSLPLKVGGRLNPKALRYQDAIL